MIKNNVDIDLNKRQLSLRSINHEGGIRPLFLLRLKNRIKRLQQKFVQSNKINDMESESGFGVAKVARFYFVWGWLKGAFFFLYFRGQRILNPCIVAFYLLQQRGNLFQAPVPTPLL